MVDPVECGFQVGVKNPLPLRVLPGESEVDHLDRVMASAARPEPVLLGSNQASHSGSNALRTRCC